MASQAGGVTETLVGREPEVGRVLGLLDDPGRARSIVIAGEPGMGASALWRAGVERARSLDMTVLGSRPAEEELQSPLVALHDLFEGTEVPHQVLDPETDRFERGRAVLATLRDMAAGGPLVVAIDEVQWLDPLSAQALRYALRRLDPEPVTALVSSRTDPSHSPPNLVADARRLEVVPVQPLDAEAIAKVVRAVVPHVSRPVLAQIQQRSGGNPLYAIELARCADRVGGELDAWAPPTLVAALSQRLQDLPPEVHDVLEVAAALGPSSLDTLARACPAGDGEALSAAFDAGVVLLVGHQARVAHPMLASAVLTQMNPVRLRRIHADLADKVDDPDERARHLALSGDRPDRAVASELEEAATRAARRGASGLAAELARHSVRLTPTDDDAAVRRGLLGVGYRAAAGEVARALEQSARLLPTIGSRRARVSALTQLVALDFSRADELLTQAALDAGDDERLLAGVLELHAWALRTYRGDLHGSKERGEEALALAVRVGDEAVEMLASATMATTCLQMGDRRDDLLDRGLELARTHRGPRLGRGPLVSQAHHALWDGDLPTARRHLEALHRAYVSSGTEFQRPYRLLDLARVEIACGDFAAAADLVDDGLESAADAQNRQAEMWLRHQEGVVWAHLGHADRSDRAAETLARWGVEYHEDPRIVMAHHVRGVAALARGDGEAARRELLPAVELVAAAGHRHPGFLPVVPEAIAAAALVGDIDTGHRLLADLTATAATVGSPWVDALATRSTGLLALAAGRPDAADVLGQAAGALDDLGFRHDAARTRFAQGRGLRRAGQRTRADEVLHVARAWFEAAGTETWLDQTDQELRRVSGERSDEVLTPTEAQVVQLVTAGRRNREVAAELFVSVATVEAHLTRIYRKLGVRSRTELAHRLSEA